MEWTAASSRRRLLGLRFEKFASEVRHLAAFGERRGKSAEESATLFSADWPEPIARGAVSLDRVIDIQEAEQKDTAVSVLQNLPPALRTSGREKNPVLQGSARNARARFRRVIRGFHFAPPAIASKARKGLADFLFIARTG